MSAYRVVLFVDDPKTSATNYIDAEIRHMIRLYNSDMPLLQISHSSTTPTESATGPDGKVMPSES